MKFTHLTPFLALFIGGTNASHIVSGSTARLPMSLSSVINDLEAEGASKITTVAFLTSRGITQSKKATLLKTLFGISSSSSASNGEEEEEVVTEGTTAFGKKMNDEHEGDEDEEEMGEEDADDERTGIAVANPLSDASVNEVAATVQACGGNILYVVSSEDLNRGEGLFEKLAPALERILNYDATDNTASSESSNSSEEHSEQKIKNLVVVVEGATTAEDLMAAKAKLESSAAAALNTIVQPNPNNRVTTLQQVFDSVEFVVSSGPVDELLEDIGGFCGPSEAAANVAKSSVFMAGDSGSSLSATALSQSPLDLAAARKLLPLSRDTLSNCLAIVQANTGTELNPDFGELCDAAVQTAMNNFDTKAGTTLLSSSSVAKRIRSDLYDEIYAELGALYEEQLELLHVASFAMFKSNLSKLRLSPNLAADMEKTAAEVVSAFIATSKKLRAKKGNALYWPKADANATNLKKELKEYITLRLQAARADGKFKPLPRKGVTLGFHWLLPKPFGNDYRQEPWQVHAKDDLVYVPKDKITDVRKEDVMSGDWRNNVVPCPTANEMMYLK